VTLASSTLRCSTTIFLTRSAISLIRFFLVCSGLRRLFVLALAVSSAALV
jgi:hypothetical protein